MDQAFLYATTAAALDAPKVIAYDAYIVRGDPWYGPVDDMKWLMQHCKDDIDEILSDHWRTMLGIYDDILVMEKSLKASGMFPFPTYQTHGAELDYGVNVDADPVYEDAPPTKVPALPCEAHHTAKFNESAAWAAVVALSRGA